MKILQVNKYFHPHIGGIETVVRDIHQVFGNENIEGDVLCFAEDKHDSVEVARSGFNGSANTIYRQSRAGVAFGMPLSWSFLKKFKEIAGNYDLIILHHPFPFGFFAYWLYAQNKPMVVWYHSDIVRQKAMAMFIRPLLKMVLQKALRVIVSHEAIAENSNLLNNCRSKLIVIPFLGGQLPAKKVNEKGSGNSANQIVQILSVGRLVYYKGYEYLIKAMAGVDAELAIVGQGPLRKQLKDLIKDLELVNVRIIPPVADLSALYADSDIFVLPSIAKSEAFGLVQLEAMSHGLPVINTNLPTAVPTVSLHEYTGLTVRPADESALRQAIMRLTDDPELRHRYGQAALARVTGEYSYGRFRENLKKLIELTIIDHE
ncbi:glycosyltransferase [bacterium]|nr:MAG: glycosyltransferase [bacterium]